MKGWKLFAAVLVMSAAAPVVAQNAPPVPVNVESDQMEVRETERVAIFTGNVEAVRGDTRMISAKMIVHYAPKPDAAAKAGAGALGASQVTLIESEGWVRIETPGQVIVGDASVLDVATDILTVTGKVTVTQGQSVVKGTRLVADLKKKTSQMTGGRVTGSFVPGQKSP